MNTLMVGGLAPFIVLVVLIAAIAVVAGALWAFSLAAHAVSSFTGKEGKTAEDTLRQLNHGPEDN